MKSLCIVFPTLARYFGDMLEACVQLESYYQKAPVRPIYVSTMKRAYYFENAQGAFGEFERGDRFLVFQGEEQYFEQDTLFKGSFPSQILRREIAWEGIKFRVGIVTIDHVLEQTFVELGIGINTFSENEWISVEDYPSFVALSQTS